MAAMEGKVAMCMVGLVDLRARHSPKSEQKEGTSLDSPHAVMSRQD
jgi:hypothetical protein